ncbi:MAG TPA: Wzz/FepE/Etk N-terminal domain-containing protein [Rhodopila sp.]|nr:Wzz/FepE/Etk N-terminal domain-containing protein [Rhodopila sp.]
MLHSDALQSASFELPGHIPGPDDQEAINFQAIRRFIRKRGRICLLWVLGGLLVGTAYAILSAPSYTASASVLLEDQAAASAADAAVQTDAAHSTYVETQVQVFESDEIIGRVVDSKKLLDDPEFGRTAGGLRALAMRYARALLRPSSPVPKHEPRYATIVRVRRALSVHRVGTSDILEVQFTSHDSTRSADMANAIIQSYIDSRLAVQRNAHAETAAHVSKLLTEMRDKAFPPEATQDAVAATAGSGAQARARFLEQQDRTNTYRALYSKLLQRALGDADSQFLSPGILVITPAAPPLLASSRVIVVAAFTVVGGVIGLGRALIQEATDDLLRTTDDVQRSDGLERVTSAPELARADLRAPARAGSDLQPSYLVTCDPLYEAVARMAVTLPDSATRRGARVIGMAAPVDGVGVSLLAAHLARVIAESGQRTLLLDANWRQRPVDDAALPVGQSRRLASARSIIKLGSDTLDVLILRATAPLSELNASLSIASAIESVRLDYDCIVVDFHSLARTADLEAAIGLVDQVVVVAQSRRTRTPELREALKSVPRHKLGAVILNRVRLVGKAAGRRAQRRQATVSKVPA